MKKVIFIILLVGSITESNPISKEKIVELWHCATQKQSKCTLKQRNIARLKLAAIPFSIIATALAAYGLYKLQKQPSQASEDTPEINTLLSEILPSINSKIEFLTVTRQDYTIEYYKHGPILTLKLNTQKDIAPEKYRSFAQEIANRLSKNPELGINEIKYSYSSPSSHIGYSLLIKKMMPEEKTTPKKYGPEDVQLYD